jgi:hypothetical protein
MRNRRRRSRATLNLAKYMILIGKRRDLLTQ